MKLLLKYKESQKGEDIPHLLRVEYLNKEYLVQDLLDAVKKAIDQESYNFKFLGKDFLLENFGLDATQWRFPFKCYTSYSTGKSEKVFVESELKGLIEKSVITLDEWFFSDKVHSNWF